MLKKFAYRRARTLNEASAAARLPGARIMAGGTDLLGCIRDDVFEATTVVSISQLKQLKGISATPAGGLRIGALTTLSEVASSKEIREKYTALAEAAASAASPQLRNQGTLGGNICQRPRCWYFRGGFNCARKGGDMCYAVVGENHYHAIFGAETCYAVHPSDTAPALVALNASIRIAGARGGRTVAAEKFFVPATQDVTKETVLAAGEIVTEVILPPAPAGMRSTYRKVRERGSWDFAIASVAVAVSAPRNARIVLGAAAMTPWRSAEAEKAYASGAAPAQVAEAAVANAQPMDKNGYKVPLFRGTVEEVLLKL
ncbi:MAG: FAD binding domain-containing protein [bacterium]|jgi:xanthine dehydrogenase YagS FAD-binding subunit